MDVQKLYNDLKSQYGPKIRFLEDKPEETIDSTVKACWQFAAGCPMSAVEAMKRPLSSLDEKEVEVLFDLLEQRATNIPLAHIVGRQHFLDIDFLTDRRALIPRKETEILGRKALELSFEMLKGRDSIHIMDICCGSGNLGLAVAHHNQKVKLYAADLSEDAVSLAVDNMHFLKLQNRVQIESGDMFTPFENEKNFDAISLVICNPPYISSAKVKKMDIEIAAHEPVLAFDGGMLGFRIIQLLIEKAPVFLEKSGWLIFEVGQGQGKFILQLCERTNRYGKLQTVDDSQGNIRVIMAQKA